MLVMRQAKLDGIPQPRATRKGRLGRYPKPLDQLPKRTARVGLYSWNEEALDVIKAANPGKSEAAILRDLIQDRAKALQGRRVAKQQEFPM